MGNAQSDFENFGNSIKDAANSVGDFFSNAAGTVIDGFTTAGEFIVETTNVVVDTISPFVIDFVEGTDDFFVGLTGTSAQVKERQDLRARQAQGIQPDFETERGYQEINRVNQADMAMAQYIKSVSNVPVITGQAQNRLGYPPPGLRRKGFVSTIGQPEVNLFGPAEIRPEPFLRSPGGGWLQSTNPVTDRILPAIPRYNENTGGYYTGAAFNTGNDVQPLIPGGPYDRIAVPQPPTECVIC